MNDGKVNRQGGGTQIGAIAEDDFAQDNRMTQGLLGVVVGGRHSVDSKEGKETVVIALGVEQALAQSFGFFFRDGFFANEMKAALEVRDLRFGIGEGNGLRVSKTPQAARAIRVSPCIRAFACMQGPLAHEPEGAADQGEDSGKAVRWHG